MNEKFQLPIGVAHQDDVDQQTREIWHRIVRDATLEMQDQCMRFVSPISHVITKDEGELEGTGAYIEWEGRRLLITNEHVLRDYKQRRFAHQFHECVDFFPLADPLALERPHVDVAVCDLADELWHSRRHAAVAIPPERLAREHCPVAGELLFVTGFPQRRSRFLFGTLSNSATRLMTQEHPIVPDADIHRNYFMIAHAPEKTQSVDPTNGVPLSTPEGMSGSLVWNTRLVECMAAARQWSPDSAQVTGMLCRWDSSNSSTVAVRIEVIRDFLQRRVPRK
jgi:hypothetical protein